MIKSETNAIVYDIIAKLDAKDGQFVHDMLIEIQRLRAKVREQSERLSTYTWTTSPDRSGGQFSDSEILDSYRNRW